MSRSTAVGQFQLAEAKALLANGLAVPEVALRLKCGQHALIAALYAEQRGASARVPLATLKDSRTQDRGAHTRKR